MIGRSEISLVIFDNDGVLVDSEEKDYEASCIVARQFNIPLLRSDYMNDLMGREPTRVQVWIAERLGAPPNEEVVDIYLQTLAACMRDVFVVLLMTLILFAC